MSSASENLIAHPQDPQPGPVLASAADWLAYFNRLPGGLAVWIFCVLEMGTFALFFVGFAWSQRSEPAVFAASQALLHPDSGTLNTLVLLTGSWLAARGVLAAKQGRPLAPWFYATACSGLLFLGIKLWEYQSVFAAGVSLSTNTFWFYYLFLTVVHALHVAFGVFFMLWLAWPRQQQSPEHTLRVSAAAVYWHLVDIIWVFLFPLIYLL